LGRLYEYLSFWDYQGVLVALSQKRGENVNSASYCEVLLKLKGAVGRKIPGQRAGAALLHRENARARTARETKERIKELQWELHEHLPYSPDWASSDFHLHGPLKYHLSGK
jgi:hypothetical protein